MKRPKISSELEKTLQGYANRNFDGNVTKAVNCLVKLGIRYERAISSLVRAERDLIFGTGMKSPKGFIDYAGGEDGTTT